MLEDNPLKARKRAAKRSGSNQHIDSKTQASGLSDISPEQQKMEEKFTVFDYTKPQSRATRQSKLGTSTKHSISQHQHMSEKCETDPHQHHVIEPSSPPWSEDDSHILPDNGDQPLMTAKRTPPPIAAPSS